MIQNPTNIAIVKANSDAILPRPINISGFRVDALLFGVTENPVITAVDAVILVLPGHVVAVPFKPLRQAAEFK